MNKGELVEKLYRENGLTKQKCRELIGSLVDKVAQVVAEGEEVRLVNFGTFKPKPRKETERIHPVTGEEIEVPPKVVPKFSPGKGFREAVEENLKAVDDGSGELEVKRS